MVAGMVVTVTSKPLIDHASWRAPVAWACWAAVGGVATLLGVGVLLASRRLAGALTAELPIAALMLTAIIAASVVFGGRLVWPENPLNRKRVDDAAMGVLAWGGSAALALVAIGCSFPFGRAWDWVVWLPIVALDQWQRQRFLRRERVVVRGPTINGIANPGFVERTELQRVVRERDANGVEAIRATLRAEFAAGQRSATLHVGFCPPLAALPRVDVEACEGPEAEVKVSQAFAHGARLELRLSEAEKEACCVMVELMAKPQVTDGTGGTIETLGS
jgi:hypothetical protein